jgi:hypothetical protein
MESKSQHFSRLLAYITTSRGVERFLQDEERLLRSLANKRRSTQEYVLKVVKGGYGAGKSHMKTYLAERTRRWKDVLVVDLDLARMKTPTDLFAEVLSTRPDIYYALYLKMRQRAQNSTATAGSRGGRWRDIFNRRPEELMRPRKKLIRESTSAELRDVITDDTFVRALVAYGEQCDEKGKALGDFQDVRKILRRKGLELFLPILKAIRTQLGYRCIYIFLDEFEKLRFRDSDFQANFVETLRVFHDEAARVTREPGNFPSIYFMILTIRVYWDEELSQAAAAQPFLERAESKVFEIPRLESDEFTTLADKLCALYEKAGSPIDASLALEIPNLHASIQDRLQEKEWLPRDVIAELLDYFEGRRR